MENILEQIGLLRDKVENLCVSIKMKIPDSIHVEALKGELPEIFMELEEIYNSLNEKIENECN